MNASRRRRTVVLFVRVILPSAMVATLTLATGARAAEQPNLVGGFSGHVIDSQGKPIEGARLYLVPQKSNIRQLGPVRAVTGADGQFQFEAPDMWQRGLDGLPTRRGCMIIATADGYGPGWRRIVSQAHVLSGRHRGRRAATGLGLELQLPLDDTPIHAQLLGADGKPLAGAHLRLKNLMLPRDDDLDVHLERERRRSPLGCTPGYERIFGAQSFLLKQLVGEAETDADGRFKLSGIGRDRLVMLGISAPTVVDTTITVMTRDSPDAEVRLGGGEQFTGMGPGLIYGAGFTKRLLPGRTISGVVRDRDTGAPVSGMWVGPKRSHAYPWISDAQGRFSVTGRAPYVENQLIIAVSPPGLPYLAAGVVVEGNEEAVIETTAGIPFRLSLFDEADHPVEAEVRYIPLWPNSHAVDLVPDKHQRDWHGSAAVRREAGSYKGLAVPGPGAVLVKTTAEEYRPASVDVESFLASAEIFLSPKEKPGLYGASRLTTAGRSSLNIADYAAIVLINPDVGSLPLELSATVVRDRPRQVSLIDTAGNPLVGARPEGMTVQRDHEPPLRTATFPLYGLQPENTRTITFTKEDRELIGLLVARGDGNTPYTVRMQQWATLKGRVLDEFGEPLGGAVVSIKSGRSDVELRTSAKSDDRGEFQITRLIPGHPYHGKIYRGNGIRVGTAAENLVLQPGEVCDLGEIRTLPIYSLAARSP